MRLLVLLLYDYYSITGGGGSIIAIIVGVILEIVFAGAQVGNGIAAIGIIVFVYDFFRKRQGPKF